MGKWILTVTSKSDMAKKDIIINDINNNMTLIYDNIVYGPSNYRKIDDKTLGLVFYLDIGEITVTSNGPNNKPSVYLKNNKYTTNVYMSKGRKAGIIVLSILLVIVLSIYVLSYFI